MLLSRELLPLSLEFSKWYYEHDVSESAVALSI